MNNKNKISLTTEEYIVDIAAYINRRNYLEIGDKFEVGLKYPNLILPFISIKEDQESKDLMEKNFIWKTENTNIKKIDRLTNVSVKKLKDNLIKTLVKGESTFAIRYAFELFCRDRDLFTDIIVNYLLNTESKTMGCFFGYSILEFLEKTKSRKIIEIAIVSLIKYIAVLNVKHGKAKVDKSEEVYRKASEIIKLYSFEKLSLDNLYRALILLKYKKILYKNIVSCQYEYFEEDNVIEHPAEYKIPLKIIAEYHLKQIKV